MGDLQHVLVLTKRYFLYASYIFVIISIHFLASLYSELEYILVHHYIGYILLASIGYIHLDDRIKVSKNTLKIFYLINIVYYLILSWYTLGMTLTLFNHILSILLIVVILYMMIDKLQKVLIDNKPVSKHDKKLRNLELLNNGKIAYYKVILEDSTLSDSQKVKFFKDEFKLFQE